MSKELEYYLVMFMEEEGKDWEELLEIFVVRHKPSNKVLRKYLLSHAGYDTKDVYKKVNGCKPTWTKCDGEDGSYWMSLDDEIHCVVIPVTYADFAEDLF